MADISDERDFFHLSRLKGFNDAVFAIVATILVLPIRKLEIESGEKETLWHLLEEKWPHVVIYLVSFLIICSIWESHVNRFRILSHADDVLTWLNLTSLLFTCFLPFCVNLEATFYTKYSPIILICCDLLILEFLEIAMIMYSFHSHGLLKEEILELPEDQRNERRNYMLLKKMVNPFLYILAASLSIASTTAAWVLMGFIMISPCIHRFLGFLFRNVMDIYMGRADFDRMFGNYIETERVEFFSDGAFAIVATLLVLDITAENFPTKADVNKLGMQKTLLNMWRDYLVFAGTFLIVALLWFTHHSLFHHIRNMNQFMLVFNNFSLACMGLTPLLTAIMNKFAGMSNENEKLAVQCSTVVVFGASMSQVIVFVIALWKGPTHLLPNASPKSFPKTHNYLALKMTVLPLVSAIAYYSTFASELATYVIYHTVIFATPLLFIMLKICFGRGGYDILHQPIMVVPDVESFTPSNKRARVSRRGRDIPTSQSIAI